VPSSGLTETVEAAMPTPPSYTILACRTDGRILTLHASEESVARKIAEELLRDGGYVAIYDLDDHEIWSWKYRRAP
jgi:hypothetical protein